MIRNWSFFVKNFNDMDILFICIVAFLLLLAVFDLWVGVSNDAVNFLNSAMGTKAASFKRIIVVATIGVFIGAAMSNGMMDVARHGIFRPENFSFYDIICIFMAVMVTDIILLDIFNSLGMPTSTTVSMVFELLGATFVVSLIKMAGGSELGFSELLNTEKALSVIMGIFLSVAIAFFFGVVVQFISRMIFSFNYKCNLKWKIGIFGGICATAIIYFILLKGAKDLTFMTPEVKAWIKHNTLQIILACFVGFTVLMQLLHFLKVNVLKVIVLMGTFALAMAFAGNDLVNFVGVPLSGLASYQDFAANGAGDPNSFLMNSLNGPANTPILFLVGAGIVMVISLATSKKAQKVSKTEIGLGSQQVGEEMFGSSGIARRLVRLTISGSNWVIEHTPVRVREWFGKRFNQDEMILENGAAFDLIRGSVNLVLSGALIALGTSLKLPLSTTFVTFMVAMGTSLSDRAWGRESAVFRITGVISVIGGWFITAGAAFLATGIIALMMHYGGYWVMIALALITIAILIHSNVKYRKKEKEDTGNVLFQTILKTEDDKEVWPMLRSYILEKQSNYLAYAQVTYGNITTAFIEENARGLSKAQNSLLREKAALKSNRSKETLCLRKVNRETAIEKSAWFHLSNSCCMAILYNLRRINEACKEHVDNNFHPLPPLYVNQFAEIREMIDSLYTDTLRVIEDQGGDDAKDVTNLRRRCDEIKDTLSESYHRIYTQLREGNPQTMTVVYVYLNLLQETQEMVSNIRKYLRAYAKLIDTDYSSRKIAAMNRLAENV